MQDKSNHPVHISQCMTKPTKSCLEPENFTSGGPEVLFSNQHIFMGHYGPPSRSNWTQWVQLLLEGSPYQNFKGNLWPLLIFQGGGGGGPDMKMIYAPSKH